MALNMKPFINHNVHLLRSLSNATRVVASLGSGSVSLSRDCRRIISKGLPIWISGKIWTFATVNLIEAEVSLLKTTILQLFLCTSKVKLKFPIKGVDNPPIFLTYAIKLPQHYLHSFRMLKMNQIYFL